MATAADSYTTVQDYQQAQADQYGIPLADYQAMLAKYPPVWKSPNQGNQYGFTPSGGPSQNPQLTSALQTLSLMKKYGGGGPPTGPAFQNTAPSTGSYLDQLGADTRTGGYGSGTTGTTAAAAGGNVADTSGLQPEQIGLQQMAQIDPNTEALRQQLSSSYLTALKQGLNPSADDYRTYLNQFQQLDPEEYAQRAGLAASMDSYLRSQQDQYALGSQLDPVTAMQVEQQARKGQADRGNLYGAGQAAVEAMSTGQAGQQLLEQRRANLQSALGGQQSYLGAGLGLGDTAMALYDRQQNNLRNAQGSALTYLGSNQTPYAVGNTYYQQALGNAATAAQGGPVYNPASLGSNMTGSASQYPQYGLDIGAQAQSYYNSLNQGSGGGYASKNRGAAAASGALSGAMGGATTGAAVGGPYAGVTALIGAGVGAALGGASGYYS